MRCLVSTLSVAPNIGDRGVRTLGDAYRYISEGPIASYRKFGFGLYLVALKDSGVSAGICGLLKRDSLEHSDIGFAFYPVTRGIAEHSLS
jgi:ribosomal-protein-alanine N-acetyltransferase